MKKILSTMLTATLCLGLLFPTYAAEEHAHFTDVPESFWGYSYVERAYSEGVISGISGDPDQYTGIFAPNDTLTNAQFATIIAQGFFSSELTILTSDPWYTPYVSVLQEQGLLNETEIGNYPNKTATRYDMAVVMVELLQNEGIAMPSDWSIQVAQSRIGDWKDITTRYQDAVAIVYALQLISGINSQGDFAGDTGITRAAMCTVYCNLSDILHSKNQSGDAAKSSSYISGQVAARNMYADMAQGLSECRIAVLYDTSEQEVAERVVGFCEEFSRQMEGISIRLDPYVQGLSDFNVYINLWENNGIQAIYLPATNFKDSYSNMNLFVQCEQLGFRPVFYGSDGCLLTSYTG